MTPFIKKKEIKQDWYLINAENAAVGRLAAFISKVLRGKNKATFNPHMDNGDFVVVTNIDKIKFSGKKFENKKYYKHTGHPGGICTIHANSLESARLRLYDLVQEAVESVPEHLIEEAVDVLVMMKKVDGKRKIVDIS